MRIDVRTDADGSTVLAVDGEVDLAVAGALQQAGIDAIEAHPAADLRVDVSQVTFMDSTGLGALIQIRNAAPDRFQLIGVSPRLAQLLEITGLSDTFQPPPTD
jgi:anti-sigma B factor antagonist